MQSNKRIDAVILAGLVITVLGVPIGVVINHAIETADNNSVEYPVEYDSSQFVQHIANDRNVGIPLGDEDLQKELFQCQQKLERAEDAKTEFRRLSLEREESLNAANRLVEQLHLEITKLKETAQNDLVMSGKVKEWIKTIDGKLIMSMRTHPDKWKIQLQTDSKVNTIYTFDGKLDVQLVEIQIKNRYGYYDKTLRQYKIVAPYQRDLDIGAEWVADMVEELKSWHLTVALEEIEPNIKSSFPTAGNDLFGDGHTPPCYK